MDVGSSIDTHAEASNLEQRNSELVSVSHDSKSQVDEIQPSSSTSSFNKEDSSTAQDKGPSKNYQIIFSKNNVCVHPTQSSSERISGRLTLMDHDSSLSMSWKPYDKESLAEDLYEGKKMKSLKIYDGNLNISMKDLYAIRGVSVSEICSIRRHIPSFGYPYIIIVLKSGISFSPLYFHSGGVREFFKHLKHYARLIHSSDDPNVFLVNDARDPLQKSLSSLKLIHVSDSILSFSEHSISSGSISGEKNRDPLSSQEDKPTDGLRKDKISNREFLKKTIQNLKEKDPADVAKELSSQLFETFSLVTKFARDTTNQIFSNDEKILSNLSISEILPDRNGEKEKEKSEQKNFNLNGSTFERDDSQQTVFSSDDSFEILDDNDKFSVPHLVNSTEIKTPMNENEWKSFFDDEGRIPEPSSLCKRIFNGGIEPSLRREVWKFILGFFPYSSTYEERNVLLEKKKKEYEIVKNQWESVSAEQAKRFSKYRDRVSGVEKDVIRTDPNHPFFEGEENPNVQILRRILITYSFYNFDLGYCQGMCDLLCPILFVMQGDEVEAFWTFVHCMERMSSNFHKDQIGMHAQLVSLAKLVELLDPHLHEYFKSEDCLNYYFCFRWVLILFKREFNFDEILRLWEILWTRHLTDYFHLYICIAILKRYRRKIMDERMEFDTLLKFVNDLSGKIILESTLLDAEALCLYAGENGEACMPIETSNSVLI